jgi:hypothetical protein
VLAHQYDHAQDVGNRRVTAFDYLDWAQRAKSLSGMAAFTGRGLAFASSEGAELVLGQGVSATLFDVLGVAPMMGRGFRAGEDSAGNDRVVVLSYGLWQSRFGGSRNVIGQVTTVNGLPYTIIGVMPRGFEFPSPEYQAWVPIELHGAVDSDQINRSAHFFYVVARLREGVSFAQADQEIRATFPDVPPEFLEHHFAKSGQRRPPQDPRTYRKALPNQHLQRSQKSHAKRPPHRGFVQTGKPEGLCSVAQCAFSGRRDVGRQECPCVFVRMGVAPGFVLKNQKGRRKKPVVSGCGSKGIMG